MTGKRYRRDVAEPTVDVTSRSFDELTARQLHDIVRLRCDVFVVEQRCAYPELDGRDVEPTTGHHWIADGDLAVACYARTLVDPGEVVRLGRVVTAPPSRGRGLAAGLVQTLIERFADRMIVLDAQSHLADWYRTFGFEQSGDEFVEDGIPHTPMCRVVPGTTRHIRW
jgi:ElaA protein